MACKYEATEMANEVAVISAIFLINLGKTTIVARSIITRPSYLYVLGACFGIDWLEEKCRPDVVKHCDEWIFCTHGQSELHLLLRWAPQNVRALFQDAREADSHDLKEKINQVKKNELTTTT